MEPVMKFFVDLSTKVRTNWGAKGDAEANVIRWTAFYSDCQHKVRICWCAHAGCNFWYHHIDMMCYVLKLNCGWPQR
jgi:hypothetical protein